MGVSGIILCAGRNFSLPECQLFSHVVLSRAVDFDAWNIRNPFFRAFGRRKFSIFAIFAVHMQIYHIRPPVIEFTNGNRPFGFY